MKGSKTAGRNAPCPCGSGKKYKKCCYEKSAVTNTRYHSLPDYAQINYATPILDENFFRSNTLREMSAPRLLYSILLMPEVEEIAERVSRKYILRGLEERQAIDDAQDIEQLIQIMQRKPDTLNHRKLINKVLGFNEKAILLIIEKLKEPQNDVFIDIAVRAIYGSGENYSNEILEVIKYHQRDAFTVCQLCMLLGFHDNSDSEQVLWTYFHFFKEHFPDETYSDGPLLGLMEIRKRREERLFGDRLN